MKYDQHRRRWQNCQRCELASQRRKIVLARGTIPCNLLFIGEAPGASENLKGRPFHGPAGKLFDSILESTIPEGVTYALTNLVACFPRDSKAVGVNEPPRVAIESCQSRLQEITRMCLPTRIICVGKLATTWCPKLLKGVYDGPYHHVDHPARIIRMDVTQKPLAIKMCRLTIADACLQF